MTFRMRAAACQADRLATPGSYKCNECAGPAYVYVSFNGGFLYLCRTCVAPFTKMVRSWADAAEERAKEDGT